MANGNHYTAEQFINAIPGTGGIVKHIANRVGCDWHTAKKYITEYSTVQKVYQAEREGVIDEVESELIEIAKGGDLGAIKFYLSTIGRDRGYGERVEADIRHSGAIEFTEMIIKSEPVDD